MPRRPPKPCNKHRHILTTPDKPCPECPTHNWGDDRRRGNRHERGYGSKWNRIRQQILRRDNYLCRICINKSRVTPATEVDHILPKSQGGTDDPENLQSLCSECHQEKTAAEVNR